MMFTRYEPADTANPQHPTWDRILGHCGRGLDDLLSTGGLESYGIMSGQDYLTSWIASMLREPETPLPYLFFFGNQNCGKSMFRWAVSYLFFDGCIAADHLFFGKIGWNRELKGAIFCYLEELGLIVEDTAERLRMYVTAPVIPLRALGEASQEIPNLTHWCQMSNQREDLPFLGKFPTTVIQVGDLEDEIPMRTLLKALKKEAPQFMTTVMNFQLPLSLPALDTEG